MGADASLRAHGKVYYTAVGLRLAKQEVLLSPILSESFEKGGAIWFENIHSNSYSKGGKAGTRYPTYSWRDKDSLHSLTGLSLGTAGLVCCLSPLWSKTSTGAPGKTGVQ